MIQDTPRKSRGQIVADNLWGSPALFAGCAFLFFFLLRNDTGERIGWTLYFCGWVPPLCMAVWCAVTRQKPGVGGVFAPVLLIAAGFVFWLNHGWPLS